MIVVAKTSLYFMFTLYKVIVMYTAKFLALTPQKTVIKMAVLLQLFLLEYQEMKQIELDQ